MGRQSIISFLSSVSKWIQRTSIPAIMNTATMKQTTPGPGKQFSLDSMTSSISHISKYVSALFLMIGALSPRREILDGLSCMINIANPMPHTGLNVYRFMLPKNANKLLKK